MEVSLQEICFTNIHTTTGTATFKLMVDGAEVTQARDTEVAAGQSVYSYLTSLYGTAGWSPAFTDYYGNTAYALNSLE